MGVCQSFGFSECSFLEAISNWNQFGIDRRHDDKMSSYAMMAKTLEQCLCWVSYMSWYHTTLNPIQVDFGRECPYCTKIIFSKNDSDRKACPLTLSKKHPQDFKERESSNVWSALGKKNTFNYSDYRDAWFPSWFLGVYLTKVTPRENERMSPERGLILNEKDRLPTIIFVGLC